MKTIAWTAVAAICVSLSAFHGIAQAQTTLAVSSWTPPSHHNTKAMAAWCGDVERVTSRRVKCIMLPKPVAAPHQALNSVRQGLADVSFTVSGYNAEPMPVATLVSAPLSFGEHNTGERLAAALWRKYRTPLEASGELRGVKLLATGASSPAQLYSTGRTITSVTDFKGLKVMVGGKMGTELVTALGGQPVVKPVSQLYEMFSGGIVDAAINPVETIKSFRLEDFVKSTTLLPGGFSSAMIVVYLNEEKWKGISPADRAAIETVSGEKLSRRFGAGFDAEDREALALLRAKGVPINVPSPEMVRATLAAVAPVRASMLAAASKDGLPNAEQALLSVREEISRTAKE